MPKITITLTDEQLDKIGYFNPWKDASVCLPPDNCRSVETCNIFRNIRIDEYVPSVGLQSDVVFWRFIPEPPASELFMEKLQTSLEL